MALSRYLRSLGPEAGTKSMSVINTRIRKGVQQGIIDVVEIVLEEDRRLDQISGQFYGTASYWWVVAAASGIGWGLQVPAGTIVLVPKDINQILGYVV